MKFSEKVDNGPLNKGINFWWRSGLVLDRKKRTDIVYFKTPIPIPMSVFTIPKDTEYRR